MELRQLRYFCKVCETGSLTAAARECSVTEQTVSGALLKLERELGCTLLERGRLGASPTPIGAQVLAHALRIAREADAIADETCGRGIADGRQVVRLASVTDGLVEGSGPISPQTIARFEETHPGASVRFFESARDFCLKAVRDGAADIAFVAGPVIDPLFDSHLVARGPVVLAFSASHPLASCERISFAQLEDETLLTPPDESYSLDVITERCRAHGFEPRMRTVVNRFYFDAAERGEGFAIVPAAHPQLAGRPGLVARPLVPEDDIRIPLYLVTSRGGMRPVVQAFVDDACARGAAGGAG